MDKGPDSRERTLRAAAMLFRRQGYHGTALQDILKAAGSPRGSLYFHFPGGKEEIGVAALQFYAGAVRAMMHAAAEASDSAEAFLALVVRNMADDVERGDYTQGCPVAAVALETDARTPLLNEAARAAFRSWEREIADGLERFGVTGEGAATLAVSALSQMEGALLLARTYRSREPLARAENALRLLARAAPRRP